MSDENSIQEEEAPSTKAVASLNKKVLTLAERIAVIYQSHAIRNVKTLANMFGCGRTQIQNIIQNSDSIMKEWNEDPDPYRLRRRTSEYVIGIGNLTYEWLVRKWLHNEDVDDAQILSVANELARLMDYGVFKASRRWLVRFKKKYKLTDMEEQRKKCLLQKHVKRKSLQFTSISFDIRDVLHENVKTALAKSLKVNFYQTLSYAPKNTDSNGKVRTYTSNGPLKRNKQSDCCFTVSPKVPRTRRSNKSSTIVSKNEPIPSTSVSESVPSTPPELETPKSSPPVLETPKSSPPVLETPKSSPPVLETPKISAPVLEIKKSSPPVLETPKISSPVLEIKKSSPPVLEVKKSSPPVLETQKLSPPVLETPKSSPPEKLYINMRDVKLPIRPPINLPIKVNTSLIKSPPTVTLQIPCIKVPPPPKSRVSTIATQTDLNPPKPTLYGHKNTLVVSEVKSLNPAAAKVDKNYNSNSIRSYQDALKLLKPLEDFVLMEQNFRAIGLIETLQDVISQHINGPVDTIMD